MAGQLSNSVTSPGTLIHREPQVLKELCEHRVPKAFVKTLAQ
ncbi:hypothetical protein [Mycobacterium malmoense]|nr:hypothetical protein [Mycobacterium malmoense]